MESVKDNVILIGMPGSGKSTVGVILAKLLGKSFIDSDIVIQQTTGKLLSEIIDSEGVDGFVAAEGRINRKIVCTNTVISTGGSAVMNSEAMEYFRKRGVVVYLSVDQADLAGRLGDLRKRGVVCREGQTLSDIYAERLPLYMKYADITIHEQGCGNARETAELAAAQIRLFLTERMQNEK